MQECSDGVVAGSRPSRIQVDDLLLCKDDELAEVCRCSICTLIYNEPVAIHCCGSIFCKECISTWLRKRAACPTCANHAWQMTIFSCAFNIIHQCSKACATDCVVFAYAHSRWRMARLERGLHWGRKGARQHTIDSCMTHCLGVGAKCSNRST